MITRFTRLISSAAGCLKLIWMLASIVFLGFCGALVLAAFNLLDRVSWSGFAAFLLIAVMTVVAPAMAYGRDSYRRELRDQEIERVEKRYQ